jgi:RecA-family ATPase
MTKAEDWNDVVRSDPDRARRAAEQAGVWTPLGAANGKTKPNPNPKAEEECTVPNFLTWKRREIPTPDWLSGTWLSTTSRVLIVGPTGLGKTMFGIALAFAIASGAAFLHWSAGRETRVLYIDGEMSRRLMQRRLLDESLRSGFEPENLFVLSKEDFDDMPPLNTEAGQAWMDAKIKSVDPHLIIADNIQSLTVGDQTKEESWSPCLPWIRSLTKRCIGQIWFHHTGHNEGHSYGTKTREWQLDTVILMERTEATDADLAFTIKFAKARERTPANRDQFEEVTLCLVNDHWELAKGVMSAKKAKGQNLSDAAKIAFKLLKAAIVEAGEQPPASNHIPSSVRVVKESLWRKYCYEGGITASDEQEARKKAFQRACDSLLSRELIGKWQDHVWIV